MTRHHLQLNVVPVSVFLITRRVISLVTQTKIHCTSSLRGYTHYFPFLISLLPSIHAHYNRRDLDCCPHICPVLPTLFLRSPARVTVKRLSFICPDLRQFPTGHSFQSDRANLLRTVDEYYVDNFFFQNFVFTKIPLPSHFSQMQFVCTFPSCCRFHRNPQVPGGELEPQIIEEGLLKVTEASRGVFVNESCYLHVQKSVLVLPSRHCTSEASALCVHVRVCVHCCVCAWCLYKARVTSGSHPSPRE